MSQRERMRQAANEGVKQSQENTDYRPTSFSTYFQLPDGTQQWFPKGDEKGVKHFIDIVPFPVGDNFPDGVWPNPGAIKENGYWHILDIHTHNNIGAANERVVCPRASFKSGIAKGEKSGCPICEDMGELQKQEPNPDKRKEIWKSMRPIRRCLYNVIVRDDGEEEAKGVMQRCFTVFTAF